MKVENKYNLNKRWGKLFYPEELAVPLSFFQREGCPQDGVSWLFGHFSILNTNQNAKGQTLTYLAFQYKN
jgi:hypothetical protein